MKLPPNGTFIGCCNLDHHNCTKHNRADIERKTQCKKTDIKCVNANVACNYLAEFRDNGPIMFDGFTAVVFWLDIKLLVIVNI